MAATQTKDRPEIARNGNSLTLALAQLNPVMGDVAGNLQRAVNARSRAAALGADLLVLPEMYLSGYPCDDLLLRADFMEQISSTVEKLAEITSDGGPAILLGAPVAEGGQIFNSAFLLDGGVVLARRDKVQLPNYGVFDEKRHFTAGQLAGPVPFRGVRLGLAICEDIWSEDVCETLAESGAEIILSINASPFEQKKTDARAAHVAARVVETGLPFIYLNMVGGQDELVFDGHSFALNTGGQLAAQLPGFTEALSVLTASKGASGWQLQGQISKPGEATAALYSAVMTGLRDYVEKNGFPGVVLGLSGGIDSALVAVLAVDALGPERVRLVMMPSRYTADISTEDAAQLAENLGVQLETIPIAEGMAAFDVMLAEAFAGQQPDVAEENLQSRLRGALLMALSNKFGQMVLATGNKSEYAAGYATLYGDMCGGYAPLKDLWKTQVFDLCCWRNQALPRAGFGPDRAVIPERIITRPPSAELRADQQDTDSLPPYDILDPILIALTEEMADIDSITARGYDRDVVARASQLLFRAEYKRFQAAPGPKLSARAFGRDRRLPLTSGFRPDKQ